MSDTYEVTNDEESGERSTGKILQDMADKKARIAHTISRLGDRIEETFDWRVPVRRRPYLAAAIAPGVGFWVVGLIRRDRASAKRGVRRSVKDEAVNRQSHPGLGASIGAAIVKAGAALLVQKISGSMAGHRVSTSGAGERNDEQKHLRGDAWGVSR